MMITQSPMSGNAYVPTRVRRRRSHKIFIDSRDLVSHENNNPSHYTYRFDKMIPNVVRAKLLSFRVPYSPTFVVIRGSDWYASGTALADQSDIHQKAVQLAATIAASNVELSSVVSTIYKEDGTVSLNVIEVFTFTRYEDPTSDTSRFRTYDVFICTGTLITSSRTDWRFQHPAADDPDQLDMAVASTASNATIAVNILEENLYLDLRMGQGQSRLNSVRAVYPQWKSFQVYRRGDFVCRAGTCYTCLRNHMSLIFNEDEVTEWKAIDQSTLNSGAANNIFYVVETNDANESIILASASQDEIVLDLAPTDVSTIDVTWKTRRGSHYIFPHTTAIDFLSFTDTANPATLKKEYRHHTLMLELEYEEETEVMALAGSDPSLVDASPNFLMSSTSKGPLGLPSRYNRMN